MYDYDKLLVDLLECSPRSKLFTTVKVAMKKRKHWKNKPRGAYVKYGVSGSMLRKE